MNEAFDEEALWIKAQLFLSHAMDSTEPRTFDEQALWASLALELLAKAALVRVSPLLIASPTEEGINLLIASGLIQGSGRFNSVTATTLFSRCAKAFRPFDEGEAKRIARGRNEYLHGGTAALTLIPAEAWWPRFWALAIVLITAQDKSIEDLVGTDRVQIVERYLAENRRNIEHRLEALLERAKQRVSMHQGGGLSAKLAADWSRQSLRAGLAHSSESACPACGATGLLEGETVESYELRAEAIGREGDYDAWVDLSVYTDRFSCAECRLVLEDEELVAAAGLPSEFTAVGDPGDYYEPDYGND